MYIFIYIFRYLLIYEFIELFVFYTYIFIYFTIYQSMYICGTVARVPPHTLPRRPPQPPSSQRPLPYKDLSESLANTHIWAIYAKQSRSPPMLWRPLRRSFECLCEGCPEHNYIQSIKIYKIENIQNIQYINNIHLDIY